MEDFKIEIVVFLLELEKNNKKLQNSFPNDDYQDLEIICNGKSICKI